MGNICANDSRKNTEITNVYLKNFSKNNELYGSSSSKFEKRQEILKKYPSQLCSLSALTECSANNKILDLESINFLDIIEESPKGIITLRASNQTNNNFLLVKFIEVIRNSNETWENTPRMLPILAEIKLLESISKNQNPSFLELLSFFEENPKPNKKVFIIIMEYGLASLKEVLEIKKEFTQDEIIAIIFPFIKAFLSIQTNEGICHRNLTPESLILNSTNNDFSYKILDFGFGWSVKNSEGNQIKADTINSFSWVYSAPEILNFIELDNKEGKYDGFKADVYSLGIIIMLMMGCDLENLMSKEGKNACFLEKQKKYPQLCELVKKMISENPNMRSSWEEVQSDFLKLKVTIYKEDRLTIENLKKPISNEEIIVNNERIIKLLREKLNRPELCYKYCDKILEYISKKSSNNNNYIKEAELYTLYGNLCLEARDGEKSLDLHEKSLEKLQSFGTQDKEKLAANFYGIGLAYYQMEKYNDSLNFQEKVLEVIAKNNIESLINSYIEISKCLRELKNYSKSVYFLAKALNICNKKYGENNKLSLKILNLHGALYKKKREYKISYEYYEKALKICKNLDPQSLEMAESMDNISLICKALGDLKNALEFRKEALTIKEKYYEEVSPEMAFSFNNLANIYKELKEFNSAIEFHEKALNIKIRLYGEKSLEAAISMNNLGNVYMMLNNFKRALEYHEKAYVIRTELLGKEDLDVAISLNNLGEVYQSILQFQKALEIHMKALEIRNKIEGSESYNIALSLYNIGVSYQGLKKYDKSLEYIHKAWEQFKKLLRGANEETKKCLEKLIDIYNTLGDKINYNRFKEILSFSETGSHSSHGSTSELKETFQPISSDEFEYRISSFLMKEIKHEKPKIMNNNDKLGNFENAFRYNKMYRCLFAKNLIFSTKILFHLLRIKLRQCERILLKAEIELKKPLNYLLDLKLIVKDLMAVGQHIMCHKEVINVEVRIDPNINSLLLKYRETKENLLKFLLHFFLTSIDKHFKRYIDENSLNFCPPAEFNQSVVIIRKFWALNFLDMDYFDVTLDTIIEAMRKVIAGKLGDQENTSKWGKIFGKYCYEYFKLKHILMNETPFINIKKESSSFYNIHRVLMKKLEYYYQIELGNDDKEKVFRMSKHFMEVVSSSFLVSNIWHIFFQENEFIMSEIPNQYNFKDEFMKVYGKSGEADINYRTCSEINEMEEILLVQQRITDTLNEISFTYDIELINNLLDYKPAIDNIYQEICVSEPEMCLDVLFDLKTIQTFARVILKIDSSFNKKLVKLRKFGHISNIGISQNVEEENYYIKMGYVAPYQTPDKSLMLWICRSCGGNYGVSEIIFQKGKVHDFASIIPEPTKALNIFQIYKDVVLLAKRSPINSFILAPLAEGNQQQILLTNLLWDNDTNSSELWESQGYWNSKTGFYILFNTWNVYDHDWALESYPKIFNPNWNLENKCFCVITIGNSICKKELITKFSKFLAYEDSFDEYILWTFRTHENNLTISNIQDNIKSSDCKLLNIFETKPNGNFALIDQVNKEGLIKDQLQGDRKAADLYFERVPQKNLYICYQWLYPMEESLLIDLEDLSLSHIKHILRTVQQDKLSFYKEILCDPTSRRFCSFIDDDYLKKRNYLDVHIIGLTASFPAFSSSFNYVKDLNIVATSLTQTNCQNFYKILPSINPLQITDTEELISKLQSLYKKIADAECEISKIFPLQIPCPNRLKFIHQINDYGLDYICGENLEDLKKNLTKEETIPIKRDFYIYAKITQNPLDKLDFDLDKIKELNFYFMAYWIRFPIQKILNKNKKVFYFVVSVYIRINAHHFNFIGLPDSYSQASCIDLNANYDRYVSPKGSSFGRDTFLFKHEQAFFNAIKPKKLELFQEKYNLGSVETNYWKIFLKKTQCEFARIWIPILWKGDGASACNNVFSVKTLKVLPNRGIQETCDGSRLPINSIYYLEVLVYTDPSSPEFKAPTSLDLEIARKHGFIPYGNKLQTYTVFEGYHTKIRLWVKPKAKINSLRKVVCKGIHEENEPPKPTPPNSVQKDIFSRVTVLSNEEEKIQDDC